MSSAQDREARREAALIRTQQTSRERGRVIKELVSQLDTLNTKLSAYESVANAGPPKIPKPRNIKARSLHVKGAAISDTHTFEHVAPDKVKGLNHHTPDIGAKRLEDLFLDIGAQWKVVNKWYHVPQIHLLLMGDYLVNAYMHPPDSISSASGVSPYDEMLGVYELLQQGIAHLRKYTTADIIITCVPGNHGRALEKRFVEEAHHSFEHVIHVLLAKYFEDDDRVFIDATPAMDKIVDVGGVKFFVTHGDPLLKGGARLSNSFANLYKRCQDLVLHTPHTFDLLICGHTHTAGYWPNWGFCNGCLVGYNEYAMKYKLFPERPSQWGWLVSAQHRRVGKVWQYWPRA